MRHALLAFAVGLLATTQANAHPNFSVVVGPKAPKLERFAADELAALLAQLFEAEVTVVEQVPGGTDHLVLVGSPKTNPAVAKAVGDKWPKLTDQGHLLRSLKLGDREALVVGGGSPVATLWAAYELGHHFGIRPFLHGDVYPEKKPELKLTGVDATFEPGVKVRAWLVFDTDPACFGGWGLDDYKKFLGQLAKLKFNSVSIMMRPAEPPLPFGGRRFPVAGDTPGRKAFKGAKEFENPATIGKTTDADRKAAMGTLAKQLSEAASGLEMEVSYSLPVPQGWNPPNLLPRIESSTRPENTGPNVVGAGIASRPSDIEVDAYYLARRALDPKLTEQAATAQFLTPGFGKASAERATLGFQMMGDARRVIKKNDFVEADVSPDSLVRQLKLSDAPPEWWAEAKKKYAGAMDEMYRAIRATYNDPARPYLLYHAKRCEFATHYFAALEAARLAGIAKAKGDKEATVAQLEKAVEATYNALNALGDVARDPSDRGVIAVLAESAYRPLKAELKAAEKK